MFPSRQDLSVSDGKSLQDHLADKDEDRNNSFRHSENIFTKDDSRGDDLHLQLSEKYMIYKDYAERSMTNPQHMGKEDNRVFYMRPSSLFLEEPRLQNQFRNEFIRQISAPPQPEPFTLMMDEVHKSIIEEIRYCNDPKAIKESIFQFFRRRQYRLQHKKHKYIQRWSHFALTSELVDKVSLKFSPNYSKLQFELENAVKRWQRLDGEDHFATKEPRPQRVEPNGEISPDDLMVEKLPKYCSLRIDDLDVYTRINGYEEKCLRAAEKFVNRSKWASMSHRFEIYTMAQEYFQNCRKEALAKLQLHSERVKEKANELVDRRKMGDRGYKEMAMIMNSQQYAKQERRQRGVRDEFIQKGKSNYDLPPMVLWNQVELKLALQDLSKVFGIHGDMELDNGNSFSYQIIVQFPTFFHTQVLRSQFAIYDAIPSLLHPGQLGKKKIQKVMQRNLRKYGKTTGHATLLERLEIQKETEATKVEYINQIERAIFGEFNNGQLEEVPKVRLKKSFWLEWICFKPEIQKEQMQQAAILNGDLNPIDECAACMLEILNINDVTNVNLTLESLSQIHSEKIKTGRVKADFFKNDYADTDSYLTEQQKSFLSLFSNSLKTKFELDPKATENEEEIPKNSLFEAPQHLLFAQYLLLCLSSRDKKNQLLYTLNAFRAIQKRITLELREFGSRDRVMGDCNIMKPNEQNSVLKTDDANEEMNEATSQPHVGGPRGGGGGGVGVSNITLPQGGGSTVGEIDNIVMDELVDINRYRYNNCFTNKQMSTCPILPKFHITYGAPIDRQEISAEFESTKDSDPKKGLAANLLGRVERIEIHGQSQCYIVTDDFGVNVMYDTTFGDMRAIEQEMLKIVSFYINKIEPIAEVDLRNIFPSVDRFQVINEIIDCEERYQRAKLGLCLNYMEAFEHTCDSLDQQRVIQIIIDLMARRPRINLEGNHFRDSYKAEIECLEMQTKLMREFIDMQMDLEFKANNEVREYLEKTYEIIYQQIDNDWQYFPSADINDEITKRKIAKFGVKSEEDEHTASQIMKEKPGMFAAKQSTVDPKQFAEMLGMPYSSLLMLMKEHHERDPVVRQTIHEHTSFIKVQEGYPIFIYDTAIKKQNKVKITEKGKEIGILDFYESLAYITKIVAVCQHAVQEIFDVHRPDNGLVSAALELNTFKFLLAELRAVKAEERGDQVAQSRDLDLIQDDTILGNSDKMMFHAKELVATIQDPKLLSNPIVMTRLDLDTINEFDFDEAQPDGRKIRKNREENQLPEDVIKAEELANVEDELADAYLKAMTTEADQDFERKAKLHQKEKNARYPRLKQKQLRLNIPSLMQLCCNGVEVMRLRHALVQAITQREVLTKIYFAQMKQMDKEGARLTFSDHFNLETFISGGEHWINFVDHGPGLTTVIPTTYAIKEFDPSMTALLNFADHEAFKALICPLGIEELRLVLRYELTHLNMLLVATRTNQILLDNSLRQLSEIEMFGKGFVVTAPAFDLQNRLVGQNLFENNLKRLPEIEKARMQDSIRNHIRPFCFDVIKRKNKSKPNVEKAFQKIRIWVNKESTQKDEIQLRMLRTTRMLLCHDYCEELTSQVALDTLKLELLHETNLMRSRAYLLPRDSRIHNIPPAKNGEHQFAAYCEEPDEDYVYTPFYDTDTMKIKNFLQIPSFKEIMNLDQQNQKFMHLNLQGLYTYDIYHPRAEIDEVQKPSLLMNEQLELIKTKLPKLTHIDIKEVDSAAKDRLRLVDFRESYNLKGNTTMMQIYYFRNLQNLFDLEFFCNKLPSKTRSIAGLEHHVSCGLPFWEEGDDAIFGGDQDDYLDSREIGNPQYSRQNENIEIKYKNQVANKVAQRLANEKKQKMQLMQELDSIKDHFTEWQTQMNCQELNTDIQAAANYLNEQVQNNYYLLLLVLMNLQDMHGVAGTCQKEMHEIRHTISLLTHQDDSKVTFTNGFHVNQAITKTSRISLDENCFKPDFSNFFKIAQPVIDEEGLTPTEFNLLAGIYLIKHDNMKSYRKDRRYIGILPARDFQYLDCKLLNLDHLIRKYIPGTMTGFESQAKQYAHIRLRIRDEKSYVANANIQREVFQEKKTFNKQLIRSRQLKRCIMILMSKSTIPLDSKALQKLMEQTNEIVSWKVMTKMDEIERSRQLNAEINRAKRAKLANPISDPIKQIAAAIEKPQQSEGERVGESLIQQYDQACCEVEVYQRELSHYMIVIAKSLIERETKSLAKAYELNGKRLEVLIHPTQQFASTFDQAVDKKSHLDIINKVGPVQKMMTQLKNRCLEIETLTSGHGIVISSKDLNETLKELCRGIVQYGEIEMRTRCEQLYLLIKEYENQLYSKDQQLLSMEYKLKHAKEELNKIVNTKVFSRGNNLIYELDRSARQLRLIKDNIHMLESGVKEQVRLYFEKDLSDTRMQLSEMSKNFLAFTENMSASLKEQVHDNICQIEMRMKVSIQKEEPKTFENREEMLKDKYSQLLKKGNTQKGDGFGGEKANMALLEEMERLKESETEARQELLAIQRFMRLQRLFLGFKDGVKQSKHDFKVENLQQQLTSNVTLWEQLAESEKREKILKQELEVSQHEIAMQEKIIDRLKEDIKQESREKQKLLQYKASKSKRLEELEQKAREFEVLENVNLQKLLQLMESKQKRIDQFERKEYDQEYALDKLMNVANQRVREAKQRQEKETEIKNEALGKLMEMQYQKEMLTTVDDQMQSDYWKQKYDMLEKETEELRDENLLLLLKLSSPRPYQYEVKGFETQRHSLGEELQTKPFQTLTAPALPSYLPFQGVKDQTQRMRGQKLEATFSQINQDMNDVLQTDQGSSEQQKSQRNLISNKRSTFELSQDEYRRRKEIAKQSHLPSILGVVNQQNSQQQIIKKKLLPQIKEQTSAGAEKERKATSFRPRHLSVGPSHVQKHVFGTKKLAAFQPNNVYHQNSSFYEDHTLNTIAGTSISKEPSVQYQPQSPEHELKNNFQNSVFNTLASRSISTKKQNSSSILMTPIKPTVFGNALIGNNEQVVKTQRNQPKMFQKRESIQQSDNLFNSLLPTENSGLRENSYFQESAFINQSEGTTAHYHTEAERSGDTISSNKIFVSGSNLQPQIPVHKMPTQKTEAPVQPVVENPSRSRNIVAVSSSNTIQMGHGPMQQSQAAITEKSNEEQRDLSFLQTRTLQ